MLCYRPKKRSNLSDLCTNAPEVLVFKDYYSEIMKWLFLTTQRALPWSHSLEYSSFFAHLHSFYDLIIGEKGTARFESTCLAH